MEKYFASEFRGRVNRGMQTIAKGAGKFELPPPPTLKISEFPKMSIKKCRNLQKVKKNIRPISGYWICVNKHFNGLTFPRCAMCGKLRDEPIKDLSQYFKKESGNE